ncbi:hypothetical protein [Mesorhizobium sp. L-8-10]|uniref:hypothetical protein n=1 Tax=Mesorhizobium sp. L-8-10 TaxID=2744523 RepID=UPI001FD61798|nr:hypothetical protein [Mesorhizobium sp. L-8-10]
MDDVSGARHERCKPIGIRLGAFGPVRGFNEMNVEMNRPGVVGSLGEHAFQPLLDISGAAFGLLAARFPIVPRLGIHCRFGCQHRQFEIVRIFVRKGSHGVSEGRVEFGAFCGRILRISRRHRFDQFPFLLARSGRERLRFLERSDRRRIRGRVHRHVDVRAKHERLTEEAHGAARIQALRLAESAPGFRVIEIGGLPEPLLEIALRLAVLGADRICQRTEIVPQRRVGFLVGLDRLRRQALGGKVGSHAMGSRGDGLGNFGDTKIRNGCTNPESGENKRRQSCNLKYIIQSHVSLLACLRDSRSLLLTTAQIQ